eukprot:GEMP01027170.1.p1 GENE.GEMP01027170.1~~GEMP01027170.1.p1  ORF type:complete len:523 (+),score=141.23 GEMP01027170.1:27-1571(+)
MPRCVGCGSIGEAKNANDWFCGRCNEKWCGNRSLVDMVNGDVGSLASVMLSVETQYAPVEEPLFLPRPPRDKHALLRLMRQFLEDLDDLGDDIGIEICRSHNRNHMRGSTKSRSREISTEKPPRDKRDRSSQRPHSADFDSKGGRTTRHTSDHMSGGESRRVDCDDDESGVHERRTVRRFTEEPAPTKRHIDDEPRRSSRPRDNERRSDRHPSADVRRVKRVFVDDPAAQRGQESRGNAQSGVDSQNGTHDARRSTKSSEEESVKERHHGEEKRGERADRRTKRRCEEDPSSSSSSRHDGGRRQRKDDDKHRASTRRFTEERRDHESPRDKRNSDEDCARGGYRGRASRFEDDRTQYDERRGRRDERAEVDERKRRSEDERVRDVGRKRASKFDDEREAGEARRGRHHSSRSRSRRRPTRESRSPERRASAAPQQYTTASEEAPVKPSSILMPGLHSDAAFDNFRKNRSKAFTDMMRERDSVRSRPGGEDSVVNCCNLCGRPGHFARECSMRLM